MASPLILVFALHLIRVFQGFETEWLLGARWGFYVYSTLIYLQTSQFMYGQAVVTASLTLLIIAFIFPLQRWVTRRRHYTTITGKFSPGLIDLGGWKWVLLRGDPRVAHPAYGAANPGADHRKLHEPRGLLQRDAHMDL